MWCVLATELPKTIRTVSQLSSIVMMTTRMISLLLKTSWSSTRIQPKIVRTLFGQISEAAVSATISDRLMSQMSRSLILLNFLVMHLGRDLTSTKHCLVCLMRRRLLLKPPGKCLKDWRSLVLCITRSFWGTSRASGNY